MDGPTDVLSFPLDAAASASTSDVPVLLGDVVVCPAVAAEQARQHAGTLDDELALLVVHGVLHVLGHDHADADQTARMQQRERALLERHHWGGPAPTGFRQHHERLMTTVDLLMLLGHRGPAADPDRPRRRRDLAQPDLAGQGAGARRDAPDQVGPVPGAPRDAPGAVHQPAPRHGHVPPDGSGVPDLAARRPAVRADRHHHRLRPQRRRVLRPRRGDAQDVGGAVGRAGGPAHGRDRPSCSCRSPRCA